jgi:hypothetical protein
VGNLENDDFESPEVTAQQLGADEGDGPSDPDAWGDDGLDLDGDGDAAADDLDGDGGWGDDDLDLGDDDPGDASPAKADGMDDVTGGDAGFFRMPKAGNPATAKWVQGSSHAADHAAAGSFESAMHLLNRQIAATEFETVKSKFLMAYMGAITVVPGMPSTPSLQMSSERKPGLPVAVHTLQSGVMLTRKAYQLFQAGKFNDAAATFSAIVAMVPMIVVDAKAEASQVKELLETSREYAAQLFVNQRAPNSLSLPQVPHRDPHQGGHGRVHGAFHPTQDAAEAGASGASAGRDDAAAALLRQKRASEGAVGGKTPNPPAPSLRSVAADAAAALLRQKRASEVAVGGRPPEPPRSLASLSRSRRCCFSSAARPNPPALSLR